VSKAVATLFSISQRRWGLLDRGPLGPEGQQFVVLVNLESVATTLVAIQGPPGEPTSATPMSSFYLVTFFFYK
jgi:hypothetical protein